MTQQQKMKNSTNPVFTGFLKDLGTYEKEYKSNHGLLRQE